jgi:hypothetical protein
MKSSKPQSENKMKRKFKTIRIVLLLSLLVGYGQATMAQKAEKIESLTRVHQTADYYAQQTILWKKELDKNKKNPDAWFNFYRANRYVAICSPNDTVRGTNRFDKLNAIIDEMEKAIPESFEFNYLKWLNSGNDLSKISFLEKAYAINPNREETYPDFVVAYELMQQQDKRDLFLKKWYETGQISSGYLHYNYNVLSSLKQDAIVLTVGDNDTYPLWILQSVFGLRKDVTVINLSMLYLEEYQKKLGQSLGFETILPSESQEKYKQYKEKIVANIASNKGQRTTYTALTVDPSYTTACEQNLYLIGLAYEYSKEKFDNIAVLKKNFEQVFALDYLSINFVKDPAESSLKMAHANYLVPMITLYEHYHLSNESDKALRLKNKIIAIAKSSGQEDSIKEYLK